MGLPDRNSQPANGLRLTRRNKLFQFFTDLRAAFNKLISSEGIENAESQNGRVEPLVSWRLYDTAQCGFSVHLDKVYHGNHRITLTFQHKAA